MMKTKIWKAKDNTWSFRIDETISQKKPHILDNGRYGCIKPKSIILSNGDGYKTKKSMQEVINKKIKEFERIDAIIDESGLFKK